MQARDVLDLLGSPEHKLTWCSKYTAEHMSAHINPLCKLQMCSTCWKGKTGNDWNLLHMVVADCDILCIKHHQLVMM